MNELARLKVLKIGSIDETRRLRNSTRVKLGVSKSAHGSYGELLSQAGINIKIGYYLAICLAASLLVASLLNSIGHIIAIFGSLSLAYYLAFWVPEELALKRRSKAISQLPGFVDGLASALATGFNIESAFIQASQSVPSGILRMELDRIVNCLNRGLSIDESLEVLRERIMGKEVISVAVSIQLFHDMGGRMLEPFRRLARKIREQQIVVEKANRDLVQIRLAFRILLFLSVAAPALLLIRSPDYLHTATSDPTGQIILQIAACLEIGALIAYKKMTLIKV